MHPLFSNVALWLLDPEPMPVRSHNYNLYHLYGEALLDLYSQINVFDLPGLSLLLYSLEFVFVLLGNIEKGTDGYQYDFGCSENCDILHHNY